MPCAISREEELYYQRRSNEEIYGESLTNHALIKFVACDLAKVLKGATPHKITLK